jgi:hypothetical protein
MELVKRVFDSRLKGDPLKNPFRCNQFIMTVSSCIFLFFVNSLYCRILSMIYNSYEFAILALMFKLNILLFSDKYHHMLIGTNIKGISVHIGTSVCWLVQ